MAKDKERSVNPAQAQRKLEKAKALKKSKAELQTRRNEKLARRNPDRIQRQIEDLKALETSGDIKPREKAILDELERDLKSVRKAREALGEKAPQYGNRQPRRDGGGIDTSVLGKRGHDGQRKPFHQQRVSSGSDTDDSVRRIPMPEDTPPPVPREFRRYHNQNQSQNHTYSPNQNQNQNPNQMPLPNNPRFSPHSIPEAKTTYSSAPQIRDLKKEAVATFIPSVVRRKQDAARGVGGLMEPEEMDRLEREGYVRQQNEAEMDAAGDREAKDEEGSADVDSEARRLAEEEARFQRELAMEVDVQTPPQPWLQVQQSRMRRNVEIEEVEDEDG